MKNLPTWMTTVTPASKVIAAILFISLPFAGFFLGTSLNNSNNTSTTNPIVVSTTIPANTPVVTTVTSTTQISDPYNDWQTYYSSFYDINIKYPSNWYLTSNQETESTCYPQEMKISSICKNGKITYEVIFITPDPFKKSSTGELNDQYLEIAGSSLLSGGIGGDSPTAPTPLNISFDLGHKNYNLQYLNTTASRNNIPTRNVTLFQANAISTGVKSNLTTFFVDGTVNQENFDYIKNIVKSIN